jgi:hypothetical protein
MFKEERKLDWSSMKAKAGVRGDRERIWFSRLKSTRASPNIRFLVNSTKA